MFAFDRGLKMLSKVCNRTAVKGTVHPEFKIHPFAAHPYVDSGFWHFLTFPRPRKWLRTGCLRRGNKYQVLLYIRKRKMPEDFDIEEECWLCHILADLIHTHMNEPLGWEGHGNYFGSESNWTLGWHNRRKMAYVRAGCETPARLHGKGQGNISILGELSPWFGFRQLPSEYYIMQYF